MRVYVTTTIEEAKGRSKTVYAADGFYEVDAALGEEWIAGGLAKEATADNEVVGDGGQPAPRDLPVHATITAGPPPSPPDFDPDDDPDLEEE